MTIEATGRVTATSRGADLLLVRSLALPAEETWAYLTDPHLTERWFGSWEGDGRTGGGVRVRMSFEEGNPDIRMRVVACDAPRRLALHAVDDFGNWQLELFVEADGEDDSLLRFVHHLDDDTNIGEVGPGWEYYLDLLVAATEDAEPPSFDLYFPALQGPYLALATRAL